jgi:hypothetical protein
LETSSTLLLTAHAGQKYDSLVALVVPSEDFAMLLLTAPLAVALAFAAAAAIPTHLLLALSTLP